MKRFADIQGFVRYQRAKPYHPLFRAAVFVPFVKGYNLHSLTEKCYNFYKVVHPGSCSTKLFGKLNETRSNVGSGKSNDLMGPVTRMRSHLKTQQYLSVSRVRFSPPVPTETMNTIMKNAKI